MNTPIDQNARLASQAAVPSFGLRISDFSRISAFGLRISAALLLTLFSTIVRSAEAPSPSLRFEVTMDPCLTNAPRDGRLFVVIAPPQRSESRNLLYRNEFLKLPIALARDLKGFLPGDKVVLDQSAYTFPITNLSQLTPGEYSVQAHFAANIDIRSVTAPGDLYSSPQTNRLEACGGTVTLRLNHQVPPELLPRDTAEIKYINLPSKLLTEFHGRPMLLRAAVLLPRDYERDPSRRYPLWVRIGGLNTHRIAVNRLMRPAAPYKGFRETWLDDNTPRFILLQLDGQGPYGDPYYVNSANNGPYGDALIQELIPYVEAKFRAIAEPRARVLSGVSTGGWVALALQIFYPNFFNGAWASCPDPVDFRALELINIYEDENAYVNRHGNERPSAREANGDVKLTMRQEVGRENLLGHGNSYTFSGDQWGAWNAVFSPRGADGQPVPLWDPQSGRINPAVAVQWKKYDLKLVLEQNWTTLGPKLRGKLHIASGEADQYFLNNAVHLLDDFLSHADPRFEGQIVYGPGKGHGWSNLSDLQMLQQMQAATESAPH